MVQGGKGKWKATDKDSVIIKANPMRQKLMIQLYTPDSCVALAFGEEKAKFDEGVRLYDGGNIFRYTGHLVPLEVHAICDKDCEADGGYQED